MAGYSSTPLAKKLGIKAGHRVKLVNAPDYYFSLFTDLPGDIKIDIEEKGRKDFIHYFAKNEAELNKMLPKLKTEINPAGMIWVSWPKKSARVKSDVNENMIRDLALKTGLVDIKVCAVDDTWSGLKLVIPVKDRGL